MNGRGGLLIRTAAVAAACSLGGCAAPLWPGFKGSPEEEQSRQRQRAMQYFVQAKVFEKQDNPLGAIVALRSAADLDPASPTIYARLADNYEKIEEYEQAILFAARALDLDPGLDELRLQLIRWYESANDPAAAAVHLEQLIARQPARWPLYSHLARLYQESGEAGRIDRLFEDLLSREDTPEDIRVNIGYALSRRGRPQKGEVIFREILEENPASEEAWIGLAEIHQARGDRDRAIEYYIAAAHHLPESQGVMWELARLIDGPEDLSRFDGADPEFLYRLGNALAAGERYKLAAKVYERIVGLQPDHVEAWLDPARYYLHIEEHDRVDELLGEAVEAMPDSVDLYLFWGQALALQERYDEAIATFRSGLERQPGNVELFERWGYVHEQQEQYEEAVEVYREGLAAGARPVPMYIRWGMVLGRQERWLEALDRFDQAAGGASDDSSLAEAYLHSGIALENLGRLQEAIEKLRQATGLDSSDTVPLFYLGSCLEQASRTLPDSTAHLDAAIAVFDRLIELDPGDAYALNYLGYMYAERGIRLEEAVGLLIRAVSIDPGNGAFLDSLGWAYYRLGEFERAERFLAKAIEQFDDQEEEDQAIIFHHAGDIAKALGKEGEAASHWRRALELTPDDEELRRKLGAGVP